jgi:hypothetical protein
MRRERTAPGRPAGHFRDEITAAAIAVADREGPDAVSMRYYQQCSAEYGPHLLR